MRRCRLSLLVGLLSFTAVGMFACGGKGGKGGKGGEGAQKKQKKAEFKPGKLVVFEQKSIGFSILKPEAVALSVKGDVAELKAEGFPKVTITLHKTREISTGSGASTRMGKYKRTVYAPMRKLVCRCDDMGQHEAMVKQICKSLKNTKAAVKKPSVKIEAPKITGKLKGGDSFAKALGALAPKILQCWSKAVAADAKFPQGHLNFMLVYKDDGSVKQSSISRTFNYKAHQPLTSCVEKLVLAVKPQPDGGEVKLGWYLRFKLY